MVLDDFFSLIPIGKVWLLLISFEQSSKKYQEIALHEQKLQNTVKLWSSWLLAWPPRRVLLELLQAVIQSAKRYLKSLKSLKIVFSIGIPMGNLSKHVQTSGQVWISPGLAPGLHLRLHKNFPVPRSCPKTLWEKKVRFLNMFWSFLINFGAAVIKSTASAASLVFFESPHQGKTSRQWFES